MSLLREMLAFEPGTRVLAVMAHPDDVDIACGGTIHRWVVDGVTVDYLIATRGESGMQPEGGEDRVEEQARAAAVLGVSSISYLEFPDGAVEASLALRRHISLAIRARRPSVVLTHTPIINFDSVRFSHPDHLAVGAATLAAVFPDARSASAFEDVGAVVNTHIVSQLLFFGHPEPDTFVRIDGGHLDAKVAAVSEHRSQAGDRMFSEFLTSWALELASSHGLPGPSEVFRSMDTR